MDHEVEVATTSCQEIQLQGDTFSASYSALLCKSEMDLRVPCFCEENVWRLAYRRLHGASAADLKEKEYFVVFVSNEQKCCPFLHQRASSDPQNPIFWDYHVILIEKSKNIEQESMVWDMDSHLPYPSPLQSYLTETFFSMPFSENDQFAPLFRIVQASDFLKNFYSDRKHMFDGSKWLATPPLYECILPKQSDELILNKKGHQSNLDQYIAMKTPVGKCDNDPTRDIPFSPYGEILTAKGLLLKFC